MKAIIRTDDVNAFNSLVQFLKTLHFDVETKNERKSATKRTDISLNSFVPMTLDEFYERNQQSQNKIASDIKKHFE